MLIKNFVNGFVSLKDENLSIIIDPWITDGIYENSWFIHPPLKKFDELYEADFVLITHIHADHFDANALKLTNSNAKILIPDIYPNRNVCKRRLPQELQHRIMFIQPKIKFQLNERCEIEFIPPMNTFGHKTDENNSNDNVPAIDTGIVVTMDGKQFVFLADNFPFESNSLSEQVNGCELFAFPYNTFADDYPLCYDDLSIDEKRQKSLNRNEHKFKLMIDVIRRMNPKNLLPYSSDFLLGGPRSNEFLSVHPEQFLRKEFIASTYERTTKIPTHFIMGNDELLIQDGIGKVTKFENDHDLKTRANELYRQKSNIHDSYKKVDMNEFIANFRIASVNARKKLIEMNLSSSWTFQLVPQDHDTLLSYDIKNDQVIVENIKSMQQNELRCIAPIEYLNALLTFKSHWDNAIISCNLSWNRSPDDYDVGIYKMLNFFHI